MEQLVTEKPCKRGCCWTPYGHSVLRDGIRVPERMRCHCHDEGNEQ